ncbi:MAG: Alpha/beta hydrolase family protein [Candidatus Accumulibacter sp. BA-94]|nr:MAG: Alpha/beta hydrolase family protein [Candidatus Accumulibacter sp. BA-94]
MAAAASAHQRAAISGLLLITPWDRLENVASHHYPLLPVRLLLRDRYDSSHHLASLQRPVLVAIAADDRIVPARFGRALYDGLPQPKRLALIEGADHNDRITTTGSIGSTRTGGGRRSTSCSPCATDRWRGFRPEHRQPAPRAPAVQRIRRAQRRVLAAISSCSVRRAGRSGVRLCVHPDWRGGVSRRRRVASQPKAR